MQWLWTAFFPCFGVLCSTAFSRARKENALYPAIAAGAAFLCVYLRMGFDINMFLWLITALLLVRVCVLDIDERRVPDEYVILLAGLGISWHVFAYAVPSITALAIWDMVLGAAAGALPLVLINLVLTLLLKKEGIGFGVSKLMASCGLFLGWKPALIALAAAAMAAGVAAFVMPRIKKTNKALFIPFGTFLSAGVFFIGLFWCF